MVAEARIREAGMDDVEGIVQLSSALFREDAGRRDPSTNLDWPSEEGREHFAGFVGQERRLCLIAESAGEMVGYLAGYVSEGSSLRPVRVAELESMYVRVGHRGRGIGASLVGEFLRWAGARKAERVSVTAYAANERAIRFYRREGFRTRSISLETEFG